MAAAAAVVVGAIAVPVVVNQRDEPMRTAPVATSPSPPPPKWVELAHVTEDGVDKLYGLSVDPDGKGWCIKVSTAGSEPRPYQCNGVPAWGNKAMSHENIVAVGVNDTYRPDRFTNLMLFVTAPQVDSLVVLADGDAAKLREVVRTAGATYYLADLGAGSTRDLYFTARDRKGKEVEEGYIW
jgi:hypothetical protein